MPFVTSFERIAEKKGEERGTDIGRRIGQIQLLEDMLGLTVTSTEELQQKSLEELDLMIGEFKAKLIR